MKLLCGVAFAMLSMTPAFAQNASNAKPTGQITKCGDDATNTYELVSAGGPTTWREVHYPEVGRPYYDEQYPVTTCENAIRRFPLKCVNQTGATVSAQKCYEGGSASAMDKWSRANPTLDVQQGGDDELFATEQKYLGACAKTDYTWKSQAPSTADVCGTRTVPLEVTCIKVASGQNTWDESLCDPKTRPAATKEVTSREGCGYDFTATAWSEVPPSCGQVTQTRQVACVGPDGETASEQKCASYLTIGADRYTSPQGVPVSEFWSKGMYPWNLGSNDAGNHILIYRMPQLCDVGDPDAVQAACDLRWNTEGGAIQPYIRPKTTQTVSDSRSCNVDPAAQYEGYHWNTPTYVPDKESTCGPNTKTGRVFCIQDEGGAEVDNSLCDPAKKPEATVPFDDTSACVPVVEEPTPAPTPPDTTPPPPEVVAVPDQGPPAEIQVGYCNYTSSGGGRYACGVRDNYRPGPAAPYPREICTGAIIAGAEGDAVGDVLGTPMAGAGWTTQPRLDKVAGARCVVHMRYGYSNDRNAGWQSVYFNGPPSGVPGGLFIGKKP